MANAFIVRPFGLKQGVDFDRVEELLIKPALEQIGVSGGTTAEIVEQGNIREDMFRLLVTADLVIADVSIHNANVFYELGIRHGLRPNATFMLRANIDEFPFDLRTDRYLSYDRANPAARIAELANALKATIDSNHIDSPVYQVLPNLKAPDPAVLRGVPSDFRETVEQAEWSRCRGDLRLLACEARSFDWAGEGLQIVGRSQCGLKDHTGARETWVWLRTRRCAASRRDRLLCGNFPAPQPGLPMLPRIRPSFVSRLCANASALDWVSSVPSGIGRRSVLGPGRPGYGRPVDRSRSAYRRRRSDWLAESIRC